MENDQKRFVNNYFKVRKTSEKKAATQSYNLWAAELAGKMVRETWKMKAEFSSLIAKADNEKANGNATYKR